MNGCGPRRDMTAGELIELLSQYPDYYPVAPYIDGQIGVLTGLRAVTHEQAPIILIGEADLPASLTESLIHGGAS